MIRKFIMPLMALMVCAATNVFAGVTPKAGDKAPDFKLQGNDGKMHKLSDFKGEYVVLYFYPADETSGCTTEACSFRDGISDITKAGAKVIGVSVQDVKSHQDFVKKYGLNFLLLADPKMKVVNEYGVYNPTWKVASRVTFIIAPDGKIAKVYPKVNPEGHAKEVLADLQAIKNRT
ncbi:MAG TPA: peroxiredoxin [Candidatus Kryptonia bacterium]